MRLIDADALLHELTEMVRYHTGEYKFGIEAARLVVMDAPTISVECKSIVPCKDCKQWDEEGSYLGRGWCGWHMKSTGPWFFCADGEKEGDEQ